MYAGDGAVALLDAVVKRFRGETALDGLSLRVEQGEAVALLGPNGAGKSTALSLLVGLRRPDAGVARLFGRDPRDPAARARLGVTPQASGFPATLRVDEIVRLVARHFPDPEPSGELLGRFGLSALARRQAGGLSGGEQRRLALALAFVGRPAAVVLDEPTGVLDVEARRLAWAGLRDYVDGGGTLLLTSHHLDEVEALARRVVVLNAGRVVAQGDVTAIRARAGLARITLARDPGLALPGVVRSEPSGGGIVFFAIDPAPVLQALVAGRHSLAGLEVGQARLEEAVIALTAGDGAGGGPA